MASNQLTFDLLLETKKATQEIKSFVNNINKTAKNIGKDVGASLQESIARQKINILQGAKYDKAIFENIKNDISKALASGELTSKQALALFKSLPKEAQAQGVKAGDLFFYGLKNIIAQQKINILQGAKYDKSIFQNIKNDIETAVKGGQITSQQALTLLKSIPQQASISAKEAGKLLFNSFQESISKVKVSILNGIKVPNTTLTKLTKDINLALSSGKLTNKQASQLLGNLNSLNGKAQQAGRSSGRSYGNAFAGIVSTILGAISFSKILSGINQATTAYKTLKLAQLGLEGTVANVNKRIAENNAVLKSSTSTLEEKAEALGYTADTMYEVVEASGSVKSSSKGLEAQIKRAERAFEDETKAIEGNISSLENKRDLEIGSLKDQKGFNTLSKEEQALEKDITTLELQRLEAVKAGDTNQIEQLDTILKQKKLDQDIAQKKLDLIDLEADKITDLYEVQIKQLRSELEAKKNKFDIDIEPAKRKLEDLQATISSSSGGTTKRIKQSVLDKIKIGQEEGIKEIDPAAVDKAVDTLYNRYDKIISKRVLMGGFKNMFLKGVTDVDLATEGLDRYINAAATGRSENVRLEDAVLNLSEAFKTGNSRLGDMSGISENFSFFQEKAVALYNKQHDASVQNFDDLTKQEQATYLLTAQLEETTDRQDGFTRAVESGLMEEEKMIAEKRRLSQAIGEELLPAMNEIYQAIIPLIKEFTNFVKNNPQVVVAITGIGTAFIGLLTVLSGVITVLPTLEVIWKSLMAGFTASNPIGWVVLAIVGLITALTLAYHNIDGFKTFVDKVWADIIAISEDLIKWFDTELKPEFDSIFEDIKIIFEAVKPALEAMWNAVRPIYESIWEFMKAGVDNFKQAFGGLIEFISGVLTLVAGILTGDTSKIQEGLNKIVNGFGDMLKAIANTFIDQLNLAIDLVNKLGNAVEDATKGAINIPDLPKMEKFAIGGDFTVGGKAGVDQNLVQFMASRGERVVVQTPLQQSDNRQWNSGNTINYINYGNQYQPLGVFSFIRSYE